MELKNKKRKVRRGALWLVCFLLIIASFLLYHWFWYKSEAVDSHIFQPYSILSAHQFDIWSVEFSPDGNWVASGSVDSTVKVWNKETGVMIHNLKQPSGVTYLTFHPNGNYIATTAYDAKVRLWKLPEGILVNEFTGHTGTVWSVSFSPEGKTIASSGEDATIKFWDIETGKLIRTLQGHRRNVWDVKFSPDGSSLASSGFDKRVKIWEVNNGRLIKTLSDHSEAIVSLAFSHNGKILASTSDDKTIKLWDTGDWQLIRTLTTPEHTQAVDFSPDDKMLLTGGRDKPSIGEFLQNFFGDAKINPGISMRLWEVKRGKLLQTFSQHANDVNDVSYSPDGKWIASGSSDKTARLWRLAH